MIRVLLAFGLVLLLALPGCIEIAEEITVNPDGSGTFKVSLDLGGIGAAMDPQNSQFDLGVLDRIRQVPADAPRLLAGAKGIGNVRAVKDDTMGLYSVAFDFCNSRALNQAFYKLAGSKKGLFSPSFIKVSGHKLVKKDIAPYLRKAMAGQEKNRVNELVYSFISYKSTCVLPSDVKKVSNIKAVQPDARTVVTSFTLDDMMRGGFDFGNVVRY